MANFDPGTGTLVYASDGSLEDRALVDARPQQLRPAGRRRVFRSTSAP